MSRGSMVLALLFATGCASRAPVATPRMEARAPRPRLAAGHDAIDATLDLQPTAADENVSEPEVQHWHEVSCAPFEYDALLRELRQADGVALFQRDADGTLRRHDVLGEPCARAGERGACAAQLSRPPSAAGPRWLATFGDRVKWIDARGPLRSVALPIDGEDEAVTIAALHGLPVECTRYKLRLLVANGARGFGVCSSSSDSRLTTSSMFVARDGTVKDVQLSSFEPLDE